MTYKTVLFDWEGVVGPQDIRSFGWLMARLTREYSVEETEVVEALGGAIGEFLEGKIDNATFWQRAGEKLGVIFTEEFQDTIWQDWHGATPLPEMQQLVREVKNRGLRTVVFSNILLPSAQQIRKQGGYDDFDAEILSCEVGLKKPDPAIYNKALEAAQSLPEECIFIDDKAHNLIPAQDLGMKTILASSPQQIKQDLLGLLEK